MITNRVTQDVVGKAGRPEVVVTDFFCLSFLFGDKLAAARRSPVPNKTSPRRSRKIATVSTTNFHHVGANEKTQVSGTTTPRGERYGEIGVMQAG